MTDTFITKIQVNESRNIRGLTIPLSETERKSLFKTGPDSVSFIENTLNAAKDHPTILPASFNTDALDQDVALFSALTDVGAIAASVASEIDDTRLGIGSKAMEEATQVYNYVKEAAKTPGLKPVAEQLGQRFKKAGKRRKSVDPAE